MRHVTDEDLVRTRETLAALAARQDALRAELDATGLGDFADRADWLIAHRTPDEELAAMRRQAALERKYLDSISVPRDREPARVFETLSVPKPRARSRRTVIAPDRALDIALSVLAKKDGREAAGWVRARAPREDAA